MDRNFVSKFDGKLVNLPKYSTIIPEPSYNKQNLAQKTEIPSSPQRKWHRPGSDPNKPYRVCEGFWDSAGHRSQKKFKTYLFLIRWRRGHDVGGKFRWNGKCLFLRQITFNKHDRHYERDFSLD